MGSLKKGVVLLLFPGLAFSGACNRAPAEEALAVAEQMLEDARGNLERFGPEDLARLSRTVDGARADLAEGRYTEALRAAQELPTRIRQAVEVADRKREAELAAAWDDVSRSLPVVLAGLRARVAGFALTPTLQTAPAGAGLEEARAELRAIGGAWDEATAAFDDGDIPRALTIAGDVATRARALAERLAPPPAPEADPR